MKFKFFKIEIKYGNLLYINNVIKFTGIGGGKNKYEIYD
jgi:hypothetical protein